MSEHQIWDVEKVQAFVANQAEAVTFFCGGSRNFAKFIDLFDGVFVLEVDLDTMNRRIDERVALDPTDFGGKPEERELAMRLHQTKEDIPKTASSSTPHDHLTTWWMRFLRVSKPFIGAVFAILVEALTTGANDHKFILPNRMNIPELLVIRL